MPDGVISHAGRSPDVEWRPTRHRATLTDAVRVSTSGDVRVGQARPRHRSVVVFMVPHGMLSECERSMHHKGCIYYYCVIYCCILTYFSLCIEYANPFLLYLWWYLLWPRIGFWASRRAAAGVSVLGGVARVYLGLGTTRVPGDVAIAYFLLIFMFMFYRMYQTMNFCSLEIM